MKLLKKLGEIILLHVAAFSFMALAPVLYLTVPFILIAVEPNSGHNGLAFLCMLLGPFAASFWTIITRMLSRYRRLTADGSPYKRSLEGVLVACGWMVVGFIGSAIAEFLFILVFRVPRGGNALGWVLWFAVAPFATFSPVILGWLLSCPWQKRRAEKAFNQDMNWFIDNGLGFTEGSKKWNWCVAHGYTMVPDTYKTQYGNVKIGRPVRAR
jgi:hypothetical protein